MPARKPEECDILIDQALKSRDLDAAVALYEPNATLVLDSGEVVIGKAAIREALKWLLGLRGGPFHPGDHGYAKRRWESGYVTRGVERDQHRAGWQTYHDQWQ